LNKLLFGIFHFGASNHSQEMPDKTTFEKKIEARFFPEGHTDRFYGSHGHKSLHRWEENKINFNLVAFFISIACIVREISAIVW
jgi:hypothetical protein